MASETTESARAAVVLAGGYSTRFGEGDKALAQLRGDPLIRRVVERVAPAVDEIVVNCRREQRDAIEAALSGVDYRIAADPVPDRGPVAGIRTGCRAADATWTFVTACDMPFVGSRLAERLFEVTEIAETVDCAVPRVEGRLRPLATVYRARAAAAAADATLEEGSGAVTGVLDRLTAVCVSEPVSARAVRDVDTRADLRAARSP